MAKTKAILVKVTPAEKTLIEQNAEASGETVGAFLRRLGMLTSKGTPKAPVRRPKADEPVDDDAAFKRLVAQKMRRFPRRRAEIEARREMAEAA
jgi:hypothetical protein